MEPSIFRAYDIRGIVDKELRIEKVYRLGGALAALYRELMPTVKRFIIGMDARPHSQSIKKELCRALQDSGMDVVFVGLVPTPVVYYGLYTGKADAGIMITASHNPVNYNGFKCLLGNEAVCGAQLKRLKSLYEQATSVVAPQRGEYWEIDLTDEYISHLCELFAGIRESDVPFVVDCANAAGAAVMPELLRRLELHNGRCIFETIEGSRPHHQANPAIEKNLAPLRRSVCSSEVWLGIGLDGDADRMGVLDSSGTYVSADKLLALFAYHLEHQDQKKVIMDIRGSQILARVLQKKGVEVISAPAGSPNIRRAMAEHGAAMAGELSCHFLFGDRYFGFDDGIYAALRLIELCEQTQKTVAELLQELPPLFVTPEFRLSRDGINVKRFMPELSRLLAESDAHINTMDGVQAVWEYGWGLIRSSNTEPLFSMRFEGKSQEHLAKVINQFNNAIETLQVPLRIPLQKEI